MMAQTLGVVFLVRSGSARRYFTLFLYLLADICISAGRFTTLFHYGLTSSEYIYFYYYSDALLTIFMYFGLMSLYSQVFEEMGASRYVRMAAVLLLGGTAWFSFQVVMNARDNMLSRFVVALSQNIYFVGVVLTYLLWTAVVKLRETRTRLIHLVLSWGVFFSAFAANYALRNLYPQSSLIWMYLPPVMAIWLPASWAYTFWKVPEDARLATARVVTAHR